VLTKPSSDSAMQYSQKAYEISADAAKELAKVFQDQFEQMNRSLRDLAQRTAHVGTTGIPGNMGPFNQVFEAANKAFENINEAVRQATENAQAMTRK
jgi:methyl-accepting chemotaxis protein